MDEYTPEALVNRDDPTPVFSMKPRRRKGSPDSAHSRTSSQTKNSLQDRLFTKYEDFMMERQRISLLTSQFRLLQQVIPADDEDDDAQPGDKASTTSPKRPAFSLPVMTNNFRRFNAR